MIYLLGVLCCILAVLTAWLGYRSAKLSDAIAKMRPSLEYYEKRQAELDALSEEVARIRAESEKRIERVHIEGVGSSDWRGLAARISKLQS